MDRPPARPGSVIAAGVLTITYGAVLLLCSVCTGFNMTIGDPVVEARLAREVPAYRVVALAHAGSDLLAGLLLLTCGVLLLNRVAAARIGAMVLCVYQLVGTVAHSIYQAIYINPVTERLMAEQLGNQPPMPIDLGGLMHGFLWIVLAAVMLFTATFCVSILVLLFDRSSRAATMSEHAGG